ncbi:hypothetical protein HN51_051940 [Arachis hypogaea]|uniref:DUF241 domain protein n=1 Tax=Arachis hypogaea TaxID=3818 RepID=A0A445CCZ9_ARAHY|nr:uncharacterized protein LOC107608296 [Arachis ipaensis]XP_025665017.1 uncharacterized protein LOC112763603 [Arachis hypogaea]QHN93173.1 uncharacterized protein DS421_17g590430 [Arachis hypogaea]RYR48733.1 hypothetical protein Ahy_A07g034809 isoform C [Arachis hypogaea]
MVGVFRRTVSFPNKNPNRPSQKPQISHHIRSISLPCRSHPLISQIKDDINGLTTWASASKFHPQTHSSLSHALTLLTDTHDTLHDILQLPQTCDSLRSNPLWVENLLEDFLRFVDVYGMFQTSVMSLKEENSAAQMALRKRDRSKLVLYAKAKKKMAKDMDKLVSGITCVTHQMHLPTASSSSSLSTAAFAAAGEAELARVISDVISVTVTVSVALFNGIAASFASRRMTWTQMAKLSSITGRSNSTRSMNYKEQEGIEELLEAGAVEAEGRGNNLRKKGEEEVRLVLKRMRDLESCICGIESVTEKVFRALINSRVALLNALTLTQ